MGCLYMSPNWSLQIEDHSGGILYIFISVGLSTLLISTEPTYLHTIDPAKSELYGGQQQTFVAPYTKCDRIEDYCTARANFNKISTSKDYPYE